MNMPEGIYRIIGDLRKAEEVDVLIENLSPEEIEGILRFHAGIRELMEKIRRVSEEDFKPLGSLKVDKS